MRSRRSASRTTSWRAKACPRPPVAAFTRQLFAVRQQVLTEFPLAAKIETPDTDKDAVIPVIRAPPPLSTARKRPSSTATAITSGGA